MVFGLSGSRGMSLKFKGGKALNVSGSAGAKKKVIKVGKGKATSKGAGKAGGACKWCATGQCWGCAQNPKGKSKGQKPAIGTVGKLKQVGKSKVAGAKKVGASPTNSPNSPKLLLNSLVMKATHSNESGQVEYETVALGAAANLGPFQSTLVVVALDPTTQYTGEIADSKKEAEQNAAQVAINELTGFSTRKGKQFAAQQKAPQAKPAATKGKVKGKVKAAVAQPAQGINNDAKSLLSRGIQIMLVRPCTKEDIVYTMEAFGDAPHQTFQARLELNTIDPPESFQGQKMDTKKEAECAAAQKALKKLKQNIQSAEKAQHARKAEKMKERNELKRAAKGEGAVKEEA